MAISVATLTIFIITNTLVVNFVTTNNSSNNSLVVSIESPSISITLFEWVFTPSRIFVF